MFLNRLEPNEKRTFILHLLYSVLDGILYGALALNEFILLKSLKGTDIQVGLLFEIPAVVLLFGVIFNEIIRRSKNKKRLLRINAILTRLPLAVFIFFPADPGKITAFHQYVFLAVLLIYYLSTTLLIPVTNLFLKNSYRHEHFGKLFSYATSVSKIFAVLATFITGLLLDADYYSFRVIFLVLAVLGIAAVWILTDIKYEEPPVEIRLPFSAAVRQSFVRMGKILTTNRAFLHFEIAFFLYGFAYLSTQGVISLLLNDVLKLNYSSLAFYKNSYNILNILLLPVFGHVIGKIDPRKFGIYTFGAMAMFLFFLFLTYYVDVYVEIWNIKLYYTLFVAYVFYGIFAALMGLLWYIGSAYFTKNQEVSDYQAIHVTLTGLRGSFAPLTGIALYRLIGYTGVFLIGIAFLFAAMGVMWFSMKKTPEVRAATQP